MLSGEKCIPCSLGTPILTMEEIEVLKASISDNWRTIQDLELAREFQFKDFKSALAFVNQIGEIAEAEGHHPDLELGWGYVEVYLTTHKINGLSRNDFIVAAKIDHLVTNEE